MIGGRLLQHHENDELIISLSLSLAGKQEDGKKEKKTSWNTSGLPLRSNTGNQLGLCDAILMSV